MYGLIIVGIVIGFFGPSWVNDVYTFFWRRHVMSQVLPKKVDEKRLCKFQHPWIKAPLLTGNGETEVHVCQMCGFIPEMNKMATLEAIDRIQENNKIREIEARIFKDFMALEDGDIQKYFEAEIKNGVSFEKLTHVHSAGLTFSTRFSNYKAVRKGDIEKALTRSDA